MKIEHITVCYLEFPQVAVERGTGARMDLSLQ